MYDTKKCEICDNFVDMKNKVELKVDNRKYSLNEIKKGYENKEFRIPKYQRGYVWDSKRRGMLIDSLVKGYPVGSIIIWTNNNFKYILDGQQRTRSLMQIREYPFKDMIFETFKSLFKNEDYVDKNKTLIENILFHFRGKNIDELYVEEYDESKKDYIKEYIFKNKTEAEIMSVNLKEIMITLKRYVKSLYDGEKFEIPSIDIISAPEEDAIEIFDRLNSQGIELTRMEKLAARWSNEIVDIKDKTLLTLISNIYRADESEDIRDNHENTPSEIIWAMLLNSFSNTKFFKELFTKSENGVEVLNHTHIDKLLWPIRLMVANYNNYTLSDYLDDSFEEDIKLGKEIASIANRDEKYIVKAMELLSKAWEEVERLCPIIKLEQNNKYVFINAASTNLFVSMASQVFWKYLKNENAIINKNLQLSLINEIINGSYQSATNKVVKDTIIDEEYLKEINIDDVRKKLREVNNLQKEEINFKNGFNNVVKMVISIAYTDLSSNTIDKYDFDHVFPKNWLKKSNMSRGQNSIGNCGLLQYCENREKQDKVIIEELLSDKLLKIHSLDEKDYEERIEKIKSNKDHDEFNKYLDLRYEIISEKFLSKINPISV